MLSFDRDCTYSDHRVTNATGHPHLNTAVQHILLDDSLTVAVSS